jgi:hypothetical protein
MKVKKNKYTQTHVPNGQCVVIYIIPYILPHMLLRGMYLKEKKEKDFKGVTKMSETNWMSDLKKGKN